MTQRHVGRIATSFRPGVSLRATGGVALPGWPLHDVEVSSKASPVAAPRTEAAQRRQGRRP